MPGDRQQGDIDAWHREAQRALNSRDFRRAHELCVRILTSEPEFSDALFLLGMIAAEHDNFGKAAEVIERAIRLDPHRSEYHAQFGRCMIALKRPREALLAAQRALAAQPQDALTFDTVGVVMTRAGAHAEAVQPFRRATELDPGKAPYQYNLGAALQFVGDFAGSQAALRRALAIEPRHFRAWSSLAQSMRSPFEEHEVELLQARLADACGVDEELHLCHALAAHHEARGEYSQAFAYLERGKRRKRASLKYSVEADRSLFETAAEVFSREFLTQPPKGSRSEEPIFIVGMPRTGTTLVERILSSHPQVFAAGELSNFGLVAKRAARTPSNLVLDAPTLRAAAGIDPALIGDEYIASTRPRTGHTPRFVDKMPLNFFYVGLIHRALPRARIICLRRDPLDTCLSNFRQLFSTSYAYYNYAYDLLDTGRYYLLFDALMQHWRAAIPASFCEVRYEDVVADAERETRRLLDFCGLPWNPACLRFHENAAPVATASAVQVRQPLYGTSVERWRKYDREIEPLRSLFASAGVPLP